jgi:hypothetical protein
MKIELTDDQFELTLQTLCEKMIVSRRMDKLQEEINIGIVTQVFLETAEKYGKKKMLNRIFQQPDGSDV